MTRKSHRVTRRRLAERWYTVRLTYPMSEDFVTVDRALFKAAGKYSDESGAGGSHRDHGWGANSLIEAMSLALRLVRVGVPGLKVTVQTGIGHTPDQISRIRAPRRNVSKKFRAKKTRKRAITKKSVRSGWKKGSMHRALGVSKGKKIPTSALRAALRRGGKTAARARFLLNLRGVKTSRLK